VRHPAPSAVPNVPGAELASVYYGRRMAGDFYDFTRVASSKNLLGRGFFRRDGSMTLL
jgi:hypothetical protein